MKRKIKKIGMGFVWQILRNNGTESRYFDLRLYCDDYLLLSV